MRTALSKRQNVIPGGPLPSGPGVYLLRFGVVGCYIGASRNIKSRILAHRARLAIGYSSHRLREAFMKCGGHDISVEVLEQCAFEVLANCEERWIDLLKPSLNYYGGSDGAAFCVRGISEPAAAK